ncbi:MAG: polysaccharide biosynthesis protein [Terrisporobacter sp.]|uniref:putative polysaccharide biosynthesis protein n=1 Tax=Clostridia TaxID=186801 RepID=UPI002FC91757
MNKQSLIKGSLILGIAGIIARFLGLFFRWPLIMLIGDEGVGYYQMSYPLYMFFIAIASGIPVAMSKIISEKNATGDIEGTFEVVKESTYLMLVLGLGTTLILFFFAKPIISFLKWNPKSYYALIGISFAPLIMSFMTIYRGFFQGLQNMTPSGVSQILEQIGRVIVGVGLAIILLPKGIEYSAGGAAFGAAAGGLIGSGYLYYQYRKIKKHMGIKKIKTNTQLLTKILKISIPISIGATVGTIMSLIDSIVVPQKLLEAGLSDKAATILYSQLTGKASVIVNIPLTLSMALCVSLIPIIAENYILKNKREVDNKVQLSIKLASVISLPCMLGMFFLAEPIMKLIFPGRFEGIEILRFLSLTIPFIIITQTTTSIMQGTGHYIIPVINLFVGCVVKIILTWVLVPIPSLNIYGAVIGSIGAYIVATILNLIAMKVNMKTKLGFYGSFVKPACAAVIMIICTVFSYNVLYNKTSSNGTSCLLAILLGIIIYGISILIFKVFSINEIKDRLIKK